MLPDSLEAVDAERLAHCVSIERTNAKRLDEHYQPLALEFSHSAMNHSAQSAWYEAVQRFLFRFANE